MGEHTKGPWEIGEQWTNGASIMATTAHPMDTSIATVHRGLLSVLVSSESADANARLIAAAPELLEALERVEREARRLHVDDILDLTAARAAIAKARGTR